MTAVEMEPAPLSRGDLTSLTRAQRDAAITAYLVDARDRLHLALEASGPEQVNSIKAEASVVAEMSRQVGVSKEIQTDAAEMVRRAEWSLNRAVREAQDRGEFARQGESKGTYHRDDNTVVPKKTLADAGITDHEWRGNGAGIGDLNASQSDFEAALEDARAEGNVSRANVVRKVKERTHAEQHADRWDRVEELAGKGWSSEQIAHEVGMSVGGLRSGARREGIEFPADVYTNKRRRIDTNEVLRKTTAGLEGICMSLAYIDLDDIEDEGEAQTWVDSLTTSISTLSKVKRQIRESI